MSEQPKKKRANERELNQDAPDDDEEVHEEQGTFARASDTEIKERKIIKARRPAGGAAEPSAVTVPSPFQGINLVAPAPSPTENPFAGILLQAAKPEEKKKESDSAAAAAKPDGGDADKKDKPAAAPSAAFASSGFSAYTGLGSFAAAAKTGTTGFGFGAGAPGAPAFTFGSFGGGGAAPAAPATGGFGGFGGFSSGAFTFGKAPAAAAAGAGDDGGDAPDAEEGGEEEGEDGEGGLRIGNGRFPDVAGVTSALGQGEEPRFQPVVVLPPAPERVPTGEEDEETVLSLDGKLYAFDKDSAAKWKERGAGELKVNLKRGDGKARLIMRQKGSGRLILNAALWAGMTVGIMEGGRGITFSVANAAVEEGEAGASGAGKEGAEAEAAAATGAAKGGAPSLATFAFRTVPRTMQDALIGTINKYKEGLAVGGAANGEEPTGSGAV